MPSPFSSYLKFFALLLVLFASFQASAYVYSYAPHTKPGEIHGYLAKKNASCGKGKPFLYQQKNIACVTCPDNGYFMLDSTAESYRCFICPPASLLVRKNGSPMCLAEKTYETVKDRVFDEDEIKKIKENILSGLSADYVVADVDFPLNEQERKPLTDACLMSFPDDDDATRAIAACQKLNETNDFLCPYISKSAQGKWLCRACPRNAPYHNEDGGCFNCPYGEEMVAQDDGTTVCASASQRPKKQEKKKY